MTVTITDMQFITFVSLTAVIVMLVITTFAIIKYLSLAKLFGKLTVLVIGKDRKVRIIKPKVKSAQFLDLGELGKCAMDPDAIYSWGSGLRGKVAFVYAPVAATLPAELGVYATKAKDAGKLDLEDAKESGFEAEVKEPTKIRWQDVVSFMLYNLNPIQIDLMIKRYVRDIYGKKQLPGWLIALVLGFVGMVVLILVLWKMGLIH